MFLIVGLGNPGLSYIRTRHNTGFLVVDRLASGFALSGWKLKSKVLIGIVNFSGHKIILAKPQTYMNNSGEAVKSLLNWYGPENLNLLVIYDDLDLPAGQLRIRSKGGDGGHQGLKSIIGMLGSREFARIRVGIGRPAEPEMDVVDWVLGRFSPREAEIIEQAVEKAARAAQVIITDGLEKAMNQFN